MEYHIIIDFLITFTYSTRQNNQMMKKEGFILNWIIGSKKFEASFAASIYAIKNVYENEKNTLFRSKTNHSNPFIYLYVPKAFYLGKI